MVLASTAYWSAYAANAYWSFHETSDLGLYAYPISYYIAYPSLTLGAQDLVMGNHIAQDQLPILLLFYIFPTPLTLLVVQAIVLSFTGLIVFFVARDILKSGGIALLFCFLYLVNPGIHGMLVFAAHLEFFIIPFYLIVFYFYMRLDKKMLVASLLLLLGTIDSAPPLAFMLAIGLYAYEITANKDVQLRKRRIQLCKLIAACSIAALLAYNLVYLYIVSIYAAGGYAQVPQALRVLPYGFVPITASLQGAEGGLTGALTVLPVRIVLPYMVYGLAVAFLGFGIGILFSAPLALVASLPWLVEIAFGNESSAFFLVSFQYFSYVLGGTIVASILGTSQLLKRKSPFGIKLDKQFMRSFVVASALTIGLVLTVIYPFFITRITLSDLPQSFLFQTNSTESAAIAQLNSVIAMVPANAPLMTSYFIMPHVTNREYLEVPGVTSLYFRPEYILVDINENVSGSSSTEGVVANFSAYLSNRTYAVYAENGTAILYKEKQ